MKETAGIDALLKEIVELQYSNPELAFTKNEQALAACLQAGYNIGYGLALNNKGNYYFWRDEADTALQWYVEADKILSKSTDIDDRIIAKTNMAMVYSKINEPEKSLSIYREVEIAIEQQPVTIKHAQIYINIDVVLLAMGKAAIAKEYALKAYQIANRLNHAFGTSLAANHIVGCCIELNELDEAEKYLKVCTTIDSASGFPQQLCMDYFRHAVIANKKQNYALAIENAQKSLVSLQQHPNAEIKIGALQALADAYAATGMFKDAYETHVQLLNEKMDFFSAEKTKTIVGLNNKYNVEKKEAQLREAQLQKLDAELKAIKSQMNPHFAFNTLKTIDYQLENNNIAEARKSLSSFAQLMRATMEQSNNEFTVIEDEVLLLENYIRLEQKAMGNPFDYSIEIDTQIDTSYERVPSIFLQPVVENAIKHGLRHKDGEKQLQVSFALINDVLQVTVQDNGIGRAASAELNKSRNNHSSFAGNALLRRVAFLNEKAGYNKYEITTEDLTQGTRVTVRIQPEKS